MCALLLCAACIVVTLGGCELAITNGLLACGQPADCPTGFSCWNRDGRCYNSEEPPCEAKSCEQLFSEFETVGILIECGSFPDGCDGSIRCGGCPEGTVCGANGHNFECGCEEVSCATAGANGAECGSIPTRCGAPGEAIDCGECPGDNQVCNEQNQCECPAGVDCDAGCSGGCVGDEVCVHGDCCEPTYPCGENECSPPGGLPNGCGGNTVCPPCAGEAECVFTGNSKYECVAHCTCESQDVECGQADICGTPTLCGSCADNGFGEGYRCQDGRCICDDPFELDSDDEFVLICGPEIGGVNCVREAWSVDVQASLHSEVDVDYYRLNTLDAETSIVAETYTITSERRLLMTYLCPDGWPGMTKCSGAVENVQGIDFCVTDEPSIAIGRSCSDNSTFKVGTLLVGVEPTHFSGGCDGYGLKIIATYAQPVTAF
jgi:hypothetical protein